MKILPDWLKNGYLRVIDPVANWLVRRRVHPNTITAIGTACSVTGGVIYGAGHISVGGFFLGLTALFDVLGSPSRHSTSCNARNVERCPTLTTVVAGNALPSIP